MAGMGLRFSELVSVEHPIATMTSPKDPEKKMKFVNNGVQEIWIAALYSVQHGRTERSIHRVILAGSCFRLCYLIAAT